MKIGIITFSSAINYGAVLQCFALRFILMQKYPEDCVKVVKYLSEDMNNERRPVLFSAKFSWRIKSIVALAVNRVYSLFYYRRLNRRLRRFDDFACRYFNFTKRCISHSDVVDELSDYSVIISGSDQVFRPGQAGADIFFLDAIGSTECLKLSYAASFGVNEVPVGLMSKISSLLREFNSLSVRENAGARIIEKLTGREAAVVLDPVFLPDSSTWQMIAGERPLIPDKYIFCYSLNGGRALNKLALALKKRTGYKLVIVTMSAWNRLKGDRVIIDAGPTEFLNYLLYSDFVITDSFHGTALSIKFKKTFFSFIAFQLVASRITELLSSFGLENRLIKNEKEMFECSLEIDYEPVAALLEDKIVYSKAFLYKNLK